MRSRLRSLLETLSELGEACARVAQEYHDIERMRGGDAEWFDAVVYMAPMVKSDGERFFAALQTLRPHKVLPRGHDAEVVLAVPRSTGALYARIRAASAEGAGQALLLVARRALGDAGLACTRARLEVDLAADGSETDEILRQARP